MSEFEYGKVKISNDIIKLIAKESALDTEGVHALCTVDADETGVRSIKNVDVQIVRGAVMVDIYLIVDYSQRINEVCRNVQKNIKEKIEVMTGLNVTMVNVHVVDLYQ